MLTYNYKNKYLVLMKKFLVYLRIEYDIKLIIGSFKKTNPGKPQKRAQKISL